MLSKSNKNIIMKSPMAEMDIMNEILEEFFKLGMTRVSDVDFYKKFMKGNCSKFANYTVNSNDKEVTVKVTIPGAVKSKLKAVLENDVLKITYVLRDVEKDTETPECTLEIKLPKAQYSVEEDFESVYSDGVLYIKLPKVKTDSKNIRIAFM